MHRYTRLFRLSGECLRKLILAIMCVSTWIWPWVHTGQLSLCHSLRSEGIVEYVYFLIDIWAIFNSLLCIWETIRAEGSWPYWAVQFCGIDESHASLSVPHAWGVCVCVWVMTLLQYHPTITAYPPTLDLHPKASSVLNTQSVSVMRTQRKTKMSTDVES